jgi:hypothetical protein
MRLITVRELERLKESRATKIQKAPADVIDGEFIEPSE